MGLIQQTLKESPVILPDLDFFICCTVIRECVQRPRLPGWSQSKLIYELSQANRMNPGFCFLNLALSAVRPAVQSFSPPSSSSIKAVCSITPGTLKYSENFPFWNSRHSNVSSTLILYNEPKQERLCQSRALDTTLHLKTYEWKHIPSLYLPVCELERADVHEPGVTWR